MPAESDEVPRIEGLIHIRDLGTPVIAVALHAGHEVRADVGERMIISDEDRLREEDPHTAEFAPDDVTLIKVRRSRFEVDLNRVRSTAVYRVPSDAWGLDIYGPNLPGEEVVERSREEYDAFYAFMADFLDALVERYGRFVLIDLHSYNHRRGGATAPHADSSENPEVNLGSNGLMGGTGGAWSAAAEVVERGFTTAGYDCRWDVKFQGGHLSRWVAGRYGDRGCAVAIEFKKTFMDEWTGVVDPERLGQGRRALADIVRNLNALFEAETGYRNT